MARKKSESIKLKNDASNTTIMVSISNHKKLLDMKRKGRLASINDVINDLIKAK